MIQAINDHVIVAEIVKEEEISSYGIIIPSTVKIEPQKYGKILSKGELVKNVEIGDIIIFHQAGGQAIILNGVIQRVLKNSEIYGILREG